MSIDSRIIEQLLRSTLTPQEEEDLIQKMERDEDVRQEVFSLLELDGALQGHFQEIDVSQPAMRRIFDLEAKGTQQNVINAAAEKRRPAEKRSSRRGGSSSRRNRATVRFMPWYRRPALLGAAAACLLVIAGALFYNQMQAESFRPRLMASILEGVPSVRIERAATTPADAKPYELFVDDRIRTGEGEAKLEIASEGSHVQLHAEADVRILPGGPEATLLLNYGTVRCRVKSQQQGEPFSVLTPHARATVHGTVFTLHTDAQGTQLEVEEGTVEFGARDRSSTGKLVQAGSRAVIAADGAAPPDAATENDKKPIILAADFDTGKDGFVPGTNIFSPSTQSSEGVPQGTLTHTISLMDGNPGGSLSVTVEHEKESSRSTSGYWSRTFTLAKPRRLRLTLDYRLRTMAGRRPVDYAALVYMVNELKPASEQDSAGKKHYVVPSLRHLFGKGDTGWVTGSVSLGSLPAGTHTLYLGLISRQTSASKNTSTAWIDNVRLTAWDPAVGEQFPLGGIPWRIPGRIEAEFYDQGGEGVAYHDTTPDKNPNGKHLRPGEGVDLDVVKDRQGVQVFSSVVAGEWLEYTVNVTRAGTYNIALRVAADKADSQVSLSFDGVTQVAAVTVPKTANGKGFKTFVIEGVALKEGVQVMRLTFGGPGYELNWIEFGLQDAQP